MSLNFATTRFGIIGTGDTGLSIMRYLRWHNANIVSIYDTRETPPNLEHFTAVNVYTGPLQYPTLHNLDIIVISPGVSIYEPALITAMNNGITVIGDVELFARSISSWSSKIIGITGSNGKTTVTTLTGNLSKQAGYTTLVAGNIGIPVLDSYIDIMKTGKIPEVIVLELSSFQLETISTLKLDVATVLNISADHLDRYRNILEYAYIKDNIFNQAKIQVLNSQDHLVTAMLRTNKPVIYFGDNPTDMFTCRDDALWVSQQYYMAVDQLQLVGWHNYYNVQASLALLHAIDVDIHQPSFKDALKVFQGLEHRMQKIATFNGVIFIEDSKGTNVGAVIAGVSGLKGKVHLILGGDGKGQDFYPLRTLVQQKCISVAIIGQDKMSIAEVLKDLDIICNICDTLPQAVQICCRLAKSGENVVLSPACASWDMFDNYKHRAKVFTESVYAEIN